MTAPSRLDGDIRITAMHVEGTEPTGVPRGKYASIGRKAGLSQMSFAPNSSYSFRLIVLGLFVSVIIMIPMAYMFSRSGGALTGGQGATDGRGGMSPLEALRTAKELRSEMGEAGAAFPRGSGGEAARPDAASRPLPTIQGAYDLTRQANAFKVQSAVSLFFVDQGQYPSKLEELPSGSLDFELDPEIYHYEVVKDPYGYRIEAVMKGKHPDAPNMVTEGGTTKFILRSD